MKSVTLLYCLQNEHTGNINYTTDSVTCVQIERHKNISDRRQSFAICVHETKFTELEGKKRKIIFNYDDDSLAILTERNENSLLFLQLMKIVFECILHRYLLYTFNNNI